MRHQEKLLGGLKTEARMKDRIPGMKRYEILVELTKHLHGKDHLDMIKDAPTESLLGLLMWYQGEKRRNGYING